MINHFHNRLAGTIIIFALGALFLPDLFDGKKESYQEDYAVIPLTPTMEKGEVQIEIQAPKQVNVSLPEPKTVTVEKDKSLNTSDNKQEKQTAKEVDAWVVQVGFFGDRHNAEVLARKIKDKGYVSHVYPRQVKKDVLNRVVVGPDLVKDNLDKIKPELEKLTGLKVQIIRFDPLDV